MRRHQAGILLPGMLLVIAGLGLTAAMSTGKWAPSPLELVAGLIFGLGISLLPKYFVYDKVEHGLLLVGGFVLVGAVVAAVIWAVAPPIDVGYIWAPALIVAGGAWVLVWAVGRQRGALLPGLSMIVAGGIGLAYGLDAFPSGFIASVATYWPGILVVAGVIAFLSAFRRRYADSD